MRIWKLKTKLDFLNIIIARSIKIGQLIQDDKKIARSFQLKMIIVVKQSIILHDKQMVGVQCLINTFLVLHVLLLVIFILHTDVTDSLMFCICI